MTKLTLTMIGAVGLALSGTPSLGCASTSVHGVTSVRNDLVVKK